MLRRYNKKYSKRDLWSQNQNSSRNHILAYLQFPQTKTGADQTEYKSIRATGRREKRRINRNSWDTLYSMMFIDDKKQLIKY
jgi:hypothetical protein